MSLYFINSTFGGDIDDRMDLYSQYIHFCIGWYSGKFKPHVMDNIISAAGESVNVDVMGLPKIMQYFAFCQAYPASKKYKIDFVKEHFINMRRSEKNVYREIEKHVTEAKGRPVRLPVERPVAIVRPVERDGDASANTFRMPDVPPTTRSVGTVTGEGVATIREERQMIHERHDNEVFPSPYVSPNPDLPRPDIIPNIPTSRSLVEVQDLPFYPRVPRLRYPQRDARYPLRGSDEFLPPPWENPEPDHGYYTTEHLKYSGQSRNFDYL